MYYLRYLCLFAHIGVQHILCCWLGFFSFYFSFFFVFCLFCFLFCLFVCLFCWSCVPYVASFSFLSIFDFPLRLVLVRFRLMLRLIMFLFVCLRVFNATFNNISVISWRSVLLVEETGRLGENHPPVATDNDERH